MKIISDFRDYYDDMVVDSGREFKRHTNGGPSKKEAFVLFHTLKLKVPIHGKVHILYDALLKSMNKTDAEFRSDEHASDYKVIMYQNPTVHDQSKLVLTPILDALSTPDVYAAQHIPSDGGKATTYEWYKVGQREYWVEHTSDDDFRSGVGDTKMRIIGGRGTSDKFGLPNLALIFKSAPLIRVAFVPFRLTNGRPGMTAVDLDTAPKLAGTPLAEDLSPQECIEEISSTLSK